MHVDCIRHCLQDNPDNVTRFLVLAREPLVIVAPRPGTFKTTIVFSLMERYVLTPCTCETAQLPDCDVLSLQVLRPACASTSVL